MFDSIKKEAEKRKVEKQEMQAAIHKERERLKEKRENAKKSILRKKIKIIDNFSESREVKKDAEALAKFEKEQAQKIAKAQAERRQQAIQRNKGRLITGGIVFLAAIIAMCFVGGHIQEKNKLERYNEAVALILNEQFAEGKNKLEGVDIKDASVLTDYATIQSNLKKYKGKESQFIASLEKVDTIENVSIQEQYHNALDSAGKAEAVQKEIAAIELKNVDLDSKDSLDTITTEYEAIEKRYQELVDRKVLDHALRSVEHIEKGDAIGTVIVAINGIGKVKLTKGKKIEQVRKQYDDLTKIEQKEVINISKLEKKEYRLDKLEQEERDRVAAEKKAAEERKAEEEAEREQRAKEEEKLDFIVLVTSGGGSYHVDGCYHIRGSDTRSMTQREAINSGYTPCSDCINGSVYPQLDNY